jgi:hypothetical protein
VAGWKLLRCGAPNCGVERSEKVAGLEKGLEGGSGLGLA